MKKQGFTLIELMVVIVIMGILAAVAVPKLFGMIAKSKASEVGPAAGTYVKLQQAYFSEANQAGGWQLIGYMAPGTNSQTTNFKYNPGEIGPKESNALASGTPKGWTAENTANLNECQAGVNWTVSLKKETGTSQDDITFIASAGGAGCVALTPTFDKIGK
ncbi:type IV pilin protein [Fibrobacter sp. UWB12]|uniref:type IV pilin protein n=1 Tax=Fibrobacter sp. UWB12 TaxID=1896203 RepID=UPI00091E7E30|nr:prepilin-type N-terminal cleavage/methylation domain-containing protein [Fibrobacter sp. UWB12]SHK89133.1 prepilin-type N-terminal cleavage/methylation domain-containing protein [Fibrobacter sp. UWB12]